MLVRKVAALSFGYYCRYLLFFLLGHRLFLCLWCVIICHYRLDFVLGLVCVVPALALCGCRTFRQVSLSSAAFSLGTVESHQGKVWVRGLLFLLTRKHLAINIDESLGRMILGAERVEAIEELLYVGDALICLTKESSLKVLRIIRLKSVQIVSIALHR